MQLNYIYFRFISPKTFFRLFAANWAVFSFVTAKKGYDKACFRPITPIFSPTTVFLFQVFCPCAANHDDCRFFSVKTTGFVFLAKLHFCQRYCTENVFSLVFSESSSFQLYLNKCLELHLMKHSVFALL